MPPQKVDRNPSRRQSSIPFTVSVLQTQQVQQMQPQSQQPQPLQSQPDEWCCTTLNPFASNKQRPKSQPRSKPAKLQSRSAVSSPTTPLHNSNKERTSILNQLASSSPIYFNDNEYNNNTSTISSNPVGGTPSSNYFFSTDYQTDCDLVEERKRQRQARTFCWYFLQSSLTLCQRCSSGSSSTSSAGTKSGCSCPYLHLDKTNAPAVRYVTKMLRKIEKYLSYSAHCNRFYLPTYTEFVQKYGRCLSEIESLRAV